MAEIAEWAWNQMPEFCHYSVVYPQVSANKDKVAFGPFSNKLYVDLNLVRPAAGSTSWLLRSNLCAHREAGFAAL